MGHSFVYGRQNTGLLWHTAIRPSVHASYDNISHLFPLLLIGHVVTYIVSWHSCLFCHIPMLKVSFRDIRGHLGTIPSIVTFYICICRRRRL